jgi:subtilisin family serine protease
MRKNMLLLGLALLLITLWQGPKSAAAEAQDHRPSYRSSEVIVRLRPSVNPQAFAASAGLRLGEQKNNQLPGQPIYRFEIADGSSPSDKAAGLAARSAVIYAEPDYIGQVPEATGRSSWVVGSGVKVYASQWAVERISLPAAQAINTGAGVTVAILDTGADLTHPALVDRLAPGYDFISNDDTPQEEGDATSGAFGHGTHVAGIVAITAPDARIMPLRTLNPDGSGDLWTQMQALRFAVDHGASVINLSFSFGERSQIFDDVVAEVSCSAAGETICHNQHTPGAVVVAAAGNTGARAREWPGASAVPGIIGVAASTDQDILADFSTYGGQIIVAAPGENITSSVPGGSYATWSGTSMAAPFVSGVAALVRSSHPDLTPISVIRQIASSSDPIKAPVHGRLNAAAALK